MSQELLTLVPLRRRNTRETPATGSADAGRGIAAPPETPSPRSSAQRLGPFGFAGDVKSAEKLQRVLQALDTPLWHTVEVFRSATNNAENTLPASSSFLTILG